ncbi:MAG: hypothetical protein KJ667_09215, partial [Alphaproteobacteria bacterium]|nr:hypothetical protein [Alphaproteobacteria bacterium]
QDLTTASACLSARRTRLRTVFNRGACTSLDLLTADFGHWPPQGLTVDKPPVQPLRIRSLFNIAAATRSEAASILHEMEHDEEARKAMTAVPGWIAKTILYVSALRSALRPALQRGVGASAAYVITSNPQREIFMRGFNFRPDGENTLSHEHIHVLQNDRLLAGKPCAFDNFHTEDLYRDDNEIDPAILDDLIYMSDESEIQVRLHIILATAYQFTQTLPQTRPELQCLLFCCGVLEMNEADEKRMSRLIAKMDRAGKPLFIPNLESRAFDPIVEAAEEIGILRDEYIRVDKQDHFKNVTLPAIYADLIDLYGDTKLAAKLRRGLPAPT